jgi:hypothetical protein
MHCDSALTHPSFLPECDHYTQWDTGWVIEEFWFNFLCALDFHKFQCAGFVGLICGPDTCIWTVVWIERSGCAVNLSKDSLNMIQIGFQNVTFSVTVFCASPMWSLSEMCLHLVTGAACIQPAGGSYLTNIAA